MFGIKKIKESILKIYMFIAPFAVSNIIQNIFGGIQLTLILQLITFIVLLMFTSKIYLNKIEKKVIILYLFPILISMFIIFINLNLKQDEMYFKYLSDNFINRAILIVLNIGIIVLALSITRNYPLKKIKVIIKSYYKGLSIFFILGIWQLLSYVINIPFFNLETRNKIHSVTSTSDYIIKKRLTSIADEPSYFTPLIIDFIILTFIFNKNIKTKLILATILLIFTYSGGGYINLIMLLGLGLLFNSKYTGRKKSILICILISSILLIFLFIFIKFTNIFNPILGRMDDFLNINKHERLYMIVYSFIWGFDEGILNCFFGLGINSYKYLNLTKFLPTGMPVHVTSNNLFTDTVIELGYFGLMCYIYIFLLLINIFIKKIKNNKFYFIGLTLVVHLLITSLYRGDYMQPRFWILMFIIFKIIDMERVNEDNDSNTNL